jgi:hypothetical protein
MFLKQQQGCRLGFHKRKIKQLIARSFGFGQARTFAA